MKAVAKPAAKKVAPTAKPAAKKVATKSSPSAKRGGKSTSAADDVEMIDDEDLPVIAIDEDEEVILKVAEVLEKELEAEITEAIDEIDKDETTPEKKPEDDSFEISEVDDTDEPVQTVVTAGATADPVKDYLKQIGKVSLLNAEMEVTLARQIEAGLFAAHKLATTKNLTEAFRETVAQFEGSVAIAVASATEPDKLLLA
ncbi:MAG: hypothetical protein EBS41_07475, partial [Actinobacteria bacterium]|nr:hypothetical protein [Actinomycetota bacterium]